MAKKGKKDSNVEVGGRFKKMLPVPINAALKQKKKDRCFDIDLEIETEQEQMEPYRARIRELQDEKRQLHEDVEKSTEDREVSCVEERDYAHREVRVIRIDTREVVERRTMTDEDRQAEIANLPKAGKKPRGLTPAGAIAAARAEKVPPAGDEHGSEDGDNEPAPTN